MKTHFHNIPKDQRTAMRRRARESLLHWKAMHVADAKRFLKWDYVYGIYEYHFQDDGQVYLQFLTSGIKLLSIEFRYLSPPGSSVTFDVTSEQWARKLFFDLIKTKSIAA